VTVSFGLQYLEADWVSNSLPIYKVYCHTEIGPENREAIRRRNSEARARAQILDHKIVAVSLGWAHLSWCE
jgi:hypothetical protein